MTAHRSDRSAVLATTLQDDLLQDLRLAVPVPVTPAKAHRPAPAPEPVVDETPTIHLRSPSPRPAAEETPTIVLRSPSPRPVADETPTIQLRVTPLRWSWPRVETVPGRPPVLTLSAGPVQISLRGFLR